ncbi:hypothetical protein TNCT_226041 [Trichonephila clavata]|uniref:Uncharacterized protein n=1 Tax=Trichonephila clavata TaxID=2740835 RepID=A0A8X6LYH0_TRICU|nr:hypothetical protein TNCT_226041 [Trichonephila clavata]
MSADWPEPGLNASLAKIRVQDLREFENDCARHHNEAFGRHMSKAVSDCHLPHLPIYLRAASWETRRNPARRSDILCFQTVIVHGALSSQLTENW